MAASDVAGLTPEEEEAERKRRKKEQEDADAIKAAMSAPAPVESHPSAPAFEDTYATNTPALVSHPSAPAFEDTYGTSAPSQNYTPDTVSYPDYPTLVDPGNTQQFPTQQFPDQTEDQLSPHFTGGPDATQQFPITNEPDPFAQALDNQQATEDFADAADNQDFQETVKQAVQSKGRADFEQAIGQQTADYSSLADPFTDAVATQQETDETDHSAAAFEALDQSMRQKQAQTQQAQSIAAQESQDSLAAQFLLSGDVPLSSLPKDTTAFPLLGVDITGAQGQQFPDLEAAEKAIRDNVHQGGQELPLTLAGSQYQEYLASYDQAIAQLTQAQTSLAADPQTQQYLGMASSLLPLTTAERDPAIPGLLANEALSPDQQAYVSWYEGTLDLPRKIERLKAERDTLIGQMSGATDTEDAARNRLNQLSDLGDQTSPLANITRATAGLAGGPTGHTVSSPSLRAALDMTGKSDMALTTPQERGDYFLSKYLQTARTDPNLAERLPVNRKLLHDIYGIDDDQIDSQLTSIQSPTSGTFVTPEGVAFEPVAQSTLTSIRDLGQLQDRIAGALSREYISLAESSVPELRALSSDDVLSWLRFIGTGKQPDRPIIDPNQDQSALFDKLTTFTSQNPLPDALKADPNHPETSHGPNILQRTWSSIKDLADTATLRAPSRLLDGIGVGDLTDVGAEFIGSMGQHVLDGMNEAYQAVWNTGAYAVYLGLEAQQQLWNPAGNGLQGGSVVAASAPSDLSQALAQRSVQDQWRIVGGMGLSTLVTHLTSDDDYAKLVNDIAAAPKPGQPGVSVDELLARHMNPLVELVGQGAVGLVLDPFVLATRSLQAFNGSTRLLEFAQRSAGAKYLHAFTNGAGEASDLQRLARYEKQYGVLLDDIIKDGRAADKAGAIDFLTAHPELVPGNSLGTVLRRNVLDIPFKERPGPLNAPLADAPRTGVLSVFKRQNAEEYKALSTRFAGREADVERMGANLHYHAGRGSEVYSRVVTQETALDVAKASAHESKPIRQWFTDAMYTSPRVVRAQAGQLSDRVTSTIKTLMHQADGASHMQQSVALNAEQIPDLLDAAKALIVRVDAAHAGKVALKSLDDDVLKWGKTYHLIGADAAVPTRDLFLHLRALGAGTYDPDMLASLRGSDLFRDAAKDSKYTMGSRFTSKEQAASEVGTFLAEGMRKGIIESMPPGTWKLPFVPLDARIGNVNVSRLPLNLPNRLQSDFQLRFGTRNLDAGTKALIDEYATRVVQAGRSDVARADDLLPFNPGKIRQIGTYYGIPGAASMDPHDILDVLAQKVQHRSWLPKVYSRGSTGFSSTLQANKLTLGEGIYNSMNKVLAFNYLGTPRFVIRNLLNNRFQMQFDGFGGLRSLIRTPRSAGKEGKELESLMKEVGLDKGLVEGYRGAYGQTPRPIYKAAENESWMEQQAGRLPARVRNPLQTLTDYSSLLWTPKNLANDIEQADRMNIIARSQKDLFRNFHLPSEDRTISHIKALGLDPAIESDLVALARSTSPDALSRYVESLRKGEPAVAPQDVLAPATHRILSESGGGSQVLDKIDQALSLPTVARQEAAIRGAARDLRVQVSQALQVQGLPALEDGVVDVFMQNVRDGINRGLPYEDATRMAGARISQRVNTLGSDEAAIRDLYRHVDLPRRPDAPYSAREVQRLAWDLIRTPQDTGLHLAAIAADPAYSGRVQALQQLANTLSREDPTQAHRYMEAALYDHLFNIRVDPTKLTPKAGGVLFAGGSDARRVVPNPVPLASHSSSPWQQFSWTQTDLDGQLSAANKTRIQNNTLPKLGGADDAAAKEWRRRKALYLAPAAVPIGIGMAGSGVTSDDDPDWHNFLFPLLGVAGVAGAWAALGKTAGGRSLLKGLDRLFVEDEGAYRDIQKAFQLDDGLMLTNYAEGKTSLRDMLEELHDRTYDDSMAAHAVRELMGDTETDFLMSERNGFSITRDKTFHPDHPTVTGTDGVTAFDTPDHLIQKLMRAPGGADDLDQLQAFVRSGVQPAQMDITQYDRLYQTLAELGALKELPVTTEAGVRSKVLWPDMDVLNTLSSALDRRHQRLMDVLITPQKVSKPELYRYSQLQEQRSFLMKVAQPDSTLTAKEMDTARQLGLLTDKGLNSARWEDLWSRIYGEFSSGAMGSGYAQEQSATGLRRFATRLRDAEVPANPVQSAMLERTGKLNPDGRTYVNIGDLPAQKTDKDLVPVDVHEDFSGKKVRKDTAQEARAAVNGRYDLEPDIAYAKELTDMPVEKSPYGGTTPTDFVREAIPQHELGFPDDAVLKGGRNVQAPIGDEHGLMQVTPDQLHTDTFRDAPAPLPDGVPLGPDRQVPPLPPTFSDPTPRFSRPTSEHEPLPFERPMLNAPMGLESRPKTPQPVLPFDVDRLNNPIQRPRSLSATLKEGERAPDSQHPHSLSQLEDYLVDRAEALYGHQYIDLKEAADDYANAYALRQHHSRRATIANQRAESMVNDLRKRVGLPSVSGADLEPWQEGGGWAWMSQTKASLAEANKAATRNLAGPALVEARKRLAARGQRLEEMAKELQAAGADSKAISNVYGKGSELWEQMTIGRDQYLDALAQHDPKLAAYLDFQRAQSAVYKGERDGLDPQALDELQKDVNAYKTRVHQTFQPDSRMDFLDFTGTNLSQATPNALNRSLEGGLHRGWVPFADNASILDIRDVLRDVPKDGSPGSFATRYATAYHADRVLKERLGVVNSAGEGYDAFLHNLTVETQQEVRTMLVRMTAEMDKAGLPEGLHPNQLIAMAETGSGYDLPTLTASLEHTRHAPYVPESVRSDHTRLMELAKRRLQPANDWVEQASSRELRDALSQAGHGTPSLPDSQQDKAALTTLAGMSGFDADELNLKPGVLPEEWLKDATSTEIADALHFAFGNATRDSLEKTAGAYDTEFSEDTWHWMQQEVADLRDRLARIQTDETPLVASTVPTRIAPEQIDQFLAQQAGPGVLEKYGSGAVMGAVPLGIGATQAQDDNGDINWGMLAGLAGAGLLLGMAGRKGFKSKVDTLSPKDHPLVWKAATDALLRGEDIEGIDRAVEQARKLHGYTGDWDELRKMPPPRDWLGPPRGAQDRAELSLYYTPSTPEQVQALRQKLSPDQLAHVQGKPRLPADAPSTIVASRTKHSVAPIGDVREGPYQVPEGVLQPAESLLPVDTPLSVATDGGSGVPPTEPPTATAGVPEELPDSLGQVPAVPDMVPARGELVAAAINQVSQAAQQGNVDPSEAQRLINTILDNNETGTKARRQAALSQSTARTGVMPIPRTAFELSGDLDPGLAGASHPMAGLGPQVSEALTAQLHAEQVIAGVRKGAMPAGVDTSKLSSLEQLASEHGAQTLRDHIAALRGAKAVSDVMLHNYANINDIDAVLMWLSPWQFWTSRTALKYMERTLDRPWALGQLARVKNTIDQETNRYWAEQGLPDASKERMTGKIPLFGLMGGLGTKVQKGLGLEGAAVGFDPLKSFFNFDMLGLGDNDLNYRNPRQDNSAVDGSRLNKVGRMVAAFQQGTGGLNPLLQYALDGTHVLENEDYVANATRRGEKTWTLPPALQKYTRIVGQAVGLATPFQQVTRRDVDVAQKLLYQYYLDGRLGQGQDGLSALSQAQLDLEKAWQTHSVMGGRLGMFGNQAPDGWAHRALDEANKLAFTGGDGMGAWTGLSPTVILPGELAFTKLSGQMDTRDIEKVIAGRVGQKVNDHFLYNFGEWVIDTDKDGKPITTTLRPDELISLIQKKAQGEVNAHPDQAADIIGKAGFYQREVSSLAEGTNTLSPADKEKFYAYLSSYNTPQKMAQNLAVNEFFLGMSQAKAKYQQTLASTPGLFGDDFVARKAADDAYYKPGGERDKAEAGLRTSLKDKYGVDVQVAQNIDTWEEFYGQKIRAITDPALFLDQEGMTNWDARAQVEQEMLKLVPSSVRSQVEAYLERNKPVLDVARSAAYGLTKTQRTLLTDAYQLDFGPDRDGAVARINDAFTFPSADAIIEAVQKSRPDWSKAHIIASLVGGSDEDVAAWEADPAKLDAFVKAHVTLHGSLPGLEGFKQVYSEEDAAQLEQGSLHRLRTPSGAVVSDGTSWTDSQGVRHTSTDNRDEFAAARAFKADLENGTNAQPSDQRGLWRSNYLEHDPRAVAYEKYFGSGPVGAAILDQLQDLMDVVDQNSQRVAKNKPANDANAAVFERNDGRKSRNDARTAYENAGHTYNEVVAKYGKFESFEKLAPTEKPDDAWVPILNRYQDLQEALKAVRSPEKYVQALAAANSNLASSLPPLVGPASLEPKAATGTSLNALAAGPNPDPNATPNAHTQLPNPAYDQSAAQFGAQQAAVGNLDVATSASGKTHDLYRYETSGEKAAGTGSAKTTPAATTTPSKSRANVSSTNTRKPAGRTTYGQRPVYTSTRSSGSSVAGREVKEYPDPRYEVKDSWGRTHILPYNMDDDPGNAMSGLLGQAMKAQVHDNFAVVQDFVTSLYGFRIPTDQYDPNTRSYVPQVASPALKALIWERFSNEWPEVAAQLDAARSAYPTQGEQAFRWASQDATLRRLVNGIRGVEGMEQLSQPAPVLKTIVDPDLASLPDRLTLSFIRKNTSFLPVRDTIMAAYGFPNLANTQRNQGLPLEDRQHLATESWERFRAMHPNEAKLLTAAEGVWSGDETARMTLALNLINELRKMGKLAPVPALVSSGAAADRLVYLNGEGQYVQMPAPTTAAESMRDFGQGKGQVRQVQRQTAKDTTTALDPALAAIKRLQQSPNGVPIFYPSKKKPLFGGMKGHF